MASPRLSSSETDDQDVYIPCMGDQVLVGPSKALGTVAFVGKTKLSDGEFIGVSLAKPEGQNDGSAKGHRYFECAPYHGIFVRASSCVKAPLIAKQDESASSSPSASPRITSHASLLCEVQRKLVKASRESDEVQIRELLPKAYCLGAPHAVIESAQRTLNFRLHESLVRDIDNVRDVVGGLTDSAKELEAAFTKAAHLSSTLLPMDAPKAASTDVVQKGSIPATDLFAEQLKAQIENQIIKGLEKHIRTAVQQAVSMAKRLNIFQELADVGPASDANLLFGTSEFHTALSRAHPHLPQGHASLAGHDEVDFEAKARPGLRTTQSMQGAEEVDLTLSEEGRQAFVTEVQQGDWLDVCNKLKNATSAIQADKQCALAAVGRDSLALEYVDGTLKSDKDFVFATVRQDGSLLRYADDTLKSDKEFMFAAVQQDGSLLRYADYSLKSDKELVRAAVQQYGLALEYADDTLKSDKELVLAAVQQDGWALQYADDIVKSDKELVLAAVQQDGSALQHADNTLKSDKELVLAAENCFG